MAWPTIALSKEGSLGHSAHPARQHRTSPLLADAALAAARPLAGQSHAATLSWDAALLIAGAGGACANLFGRESFELPGRALGEIFAAPAPLADALHLGLSRDLALSTGEIVRVDAGPCPGGAVAIVRRSATDDLELARVAAALGHEFRKAFAAVLLAVQSLGRRDEVSSDRGKRRLLIAERELRRIETVLRGLRDIGRSPAIRPVEVIPEQLAREAVESLGPRAGGDPSAILVPPHDGAAAHLDGPRIRLALEELLRYALRAVPPGGSVELRAERAPGELRYVVETRGGSAGAEGLSSGSAELALAVAQAVARAHGGSLAFESEEAFSRLVLLLPQPGVAR
jgi:signal transduction histidine kinase